MTELETIREQRDKLLTALKLEHELSRNIDGLERHKELDPNCPTCQLISDTEAQIAMESEPLSPRVQIIPIHDRVEPKPERPLRLPSPERTNGKHHHVTAANPLINRRRTPRQQLTARQRP